MLQGSHRGKTGQSLIELLLATALLSGMMLAGAAILRNLGQAQRQRDIRQVAQQLALDQVEILKSHPFARVPVTAPDDAPMGGCLGGPQAYDRNLAQFPPEELRWGRAAFRRQTCVEMVRFDTANNKWTPASVDLWTGTKRLVIRVRWPAAHPVYEEEVETLLKDPAGPLVPSTETGTLRSSVVCANPVGPAHPCSQVPFYLVDRTGALRDAAISDVNGHLVFSRIPVGLTAIRPQLESGEESSPSEYSVRLTETGKTLEGPLFTLTHPETTVTFTTNREITLVVAMPFLSEDRPPDVALGVHADPGIFSQIVNDQATIQMPPGTYFFRCWWTDFRGRIHRMDPSGGINALLISGDTPTYNCRYED